MQIKKKKIVAFSLCSFKMSFFPFVSCRKSVFPAVVILPCCRNTACIDKQEERNNKSETLFGFVGGLFLLVFFFPYCFTCWSIGRKK